MAMFRFANTPLQITIPDYREPISGIVNSAMVVGSLVELKGSGLAGDPRELVPANGNGTPAFLCNAVLADVDWQAFCKLNPEWIAGMYAIRPPVPVGSGVTARFAKEIEVENTDFVTGITGATAVGTALKVVAGKFAIATVAIPSGGGTADRVVGYLTAKKTPYDSLTFRWIITLL